MSVARGAGWRIVVSVNASYDTAAAEALIAAALVEIEAVLHGAVDRPTDSGLLAYARDTLRVAHGALEIRRRLRTGP